MYLDFCIIYNYSYSLPQMQNMHCILQYILKPMLSIVFVARYFKNKLLFVLWEFVLQLNFLLFPKRFYEDIICVKSSNNSNFAITCRPLSVFTFFKYPPLPHFKSQWALLFSKVHHFFISSHNGLKIEYQLCDTYILGFPLEECPFN